MGRKMVAAPHWMSVMNFMNDVVGILGKPGGNILKVGCLRFGNGDEVHRSGLDAGFTSHQRQLYPPLWNRLSSAMGQC